MVERSIEEEDYEEAAKSTADYADFRPPQKERSPIWRKIGIGLSILLLITALGAGAYWYMNNRKTSPPAQPAQNSQERPENTAKITTDTERFSSANFNLSFDYPKDWKADDSGNGILTVRSPAIDLLDEDGRTVKGQITMTIREKGQKLEEFNDSPAAAVLDSEKITYTQPSENQRADTYISFLSFTGLAGGIDAVYITGDSGYLKDQAVSRADIEGADPIIGISFAKCQNAQCSGGTSPISISTDNWQDESFSDPLKNMLKSLSVV